MNPQTILISIIAMYLMQIIINCLYRLWMDKPAPQFTIYFPPVDKHWNDMNFSERIKYRKWLRENHLWDGAEVIERLTKAGRLHYNTFDSNEK